MNDLCRCGQEANTTHAFRPEWAPLAFSPSTAERYHSVVIIAQEFALPWFALSFWERCEPVRSSGGRP